MTLLKLKQQHFETANLILHNLFTPVILFLSSTAELTWRFQCITENVHWHSRTNVKCYTRTGIIQRTSLLDSFYHSHSDMFCNLKIVECRQKAVLLLPLLSYFEKIAHMSVVEAYVSLWPCGSVALWLFMLGCLLQEPIRLKVLWVDA